MFDGKLKREVKSLGLKYLEETVQGSSSSSIQKQLWKLQKDFNTLLAYLGLVRIETHEVTLRKEG